MILIRKAISLFIVAFIISTSLFAQNKHYDPEKYFGLNAGVAASMVNFNPAVNQDYLKGYNGGIVFRYIEKKSLGVQAELNYSQRGWSESNGLYSKQLNYLELPFLTHFNFGNKFRFFFNIGPKISYLLSEKTLINNTLNSTEEQHIQNIQNSFDYGFCSGIGFLLNIKGQVFQFETRANYSMSDIYSNAKSDFFDNSNNINLTLNFALLIQNK